MTARQRGTRPSRPTNWRRPNTRHRTSDESTHATHAAPVPTPTHHPQRRERTRRTDTAGKSRAGDGGRHAHARPVANRWRHTGLGVPRGCPGGSLSPGATRVHVASRRAPRSSVGGWALAVGHPPVDRGLHAILFFLSPGCRMCPTVRESASGGVRAGVLRDNGPLKRASATGGQVLGEIRKYFREIAPSTGAVMAPLLHRRDGRPTPRRVTCTCSRDLYTRVPSLSLKCVLSVDGVLFGDLCINQLCGDIASLEHALF